MVLILLSILTALSFSTELLGRCELAYRRCTFDCVQEFPLDKERREGCLTRCKLDRGLCEVGDMIRETAQSVKRFLEGFSKER